MTKVVRKLPHVALIGLGAYGAASLQWDSSPYAVAACAIVIISSLCALFSTCSGSLTESLVESIMDFVPLALMNAQFYMSVDTTIAYAHLLCMAVMFFDICAKIFGNECDEKIIDRLKIASNIANVISLIYLSVKVDNYIYGVLAVLFLIRNFGPIYAEQKSCFLAEMMYLTFQVIVLALSIYLLVSPDSNGSSDSKGSSNSEGSSDSEGSSGSKRSSESNQSKEEKNTEEQKEVKEEQTDAK